VSKAQAARTPLESGAAALGIKLLPLQLDQLLAYLDLIQKWNKVYNLTAVRDPAEMLTHHLLDSLAVVAPLRVQLAAMAYGRDGAEDSDGGPQTSGRLFRLLDVGSGAGLPGAVIAICCPEISVDCVDTVAKKAAFINQVAVTLKLPNLRSIHARVENLTEQYDVISSRAFASLVDFTAWSGGALKDDGMWMAMKGQHPQAEIDHLDARVRVFHVEQLTVPGLDAERCIVWMRRAATMP
jgi:16S rRNA (guanine527-N7)-methyltransferase